MPTEMERWDPFREMMTLRSRIDHLFENVFTRPRGEGLTMFFDYPAMNVYETDGKVKVDVPLPGFKPEEVELTLSGSTLVVKGEHKTKEEVKDEDYYRHEMRYGAFTRAVALPAAADSARPEAVFEDGILSITFPKVEPVQPKRIDVKTVEPKTEPAK